MEKLKAGDEIEMLLYGYNMQEVTLPAVVQWVGERLFVVKPTGRPGASEIALELDAKNWRREPEPKCVAVKAEDDGDTIKFVFDDGTTTLYDRLKTPKNRDLLLTDMYSQAVKLNQFPTKRAVFDALAIDT